MLGFFAIFVSGFILCVVILWLYAFISCLTRPGMDTNSRILWLLVIFFLPLLGSLLFILIAPKSAVSSAPVIDVETTATNKVNSGRSIALVFGCVFLLLIIGIPMLSLVVAKLTGGSSSKQMSIKEIQSVVRNVAVAQEAAYIDEERYVSCSGSACSQALYGITIPKSLHLEVIASGQGRNSQFVIQAWKFNDPENKVVWDSMKSGFR